MTNHENNVDTDDHDDDNDDDTPFRSSLLARQDWGLGFGGGNAAVTNAVHARTLTLIP